MKETMARGGQGSLMHKSDRGNRRGGRIGFGIKGVRSVLWKRRKRISGISCRRGYEKLDGVSNFLKEDAGMGLIILVLAGWNKGP